MPNNPNIFATFRPEQQSESIVETGDVALLLKRDGSVQALNFGYDASRIRLPEDQWSEEDKFMQKQGAKLFALALAATHPQMMQILLDIAADPDVVDLEKLKAMSRVH